MVVSRKPSDSASSLSFASRPSVCSLEPADTVPFSVSSSSEAGKARTV